MIYHGNEPENHRGSHVKYCHCGKWHEGTLLEPVNYQIVVTKENPPAVLSTHTYISPDEQEIKDAENRVGSGKYTQEDLVLLLQNFSCKNYYGHRISEVESVEITDADDITQEEADEIIEEHKKKFLSNTLDD